MPARSPSKGSIAVDGVSLTVVAAEAERFSVQLIPHTLAVTTLGDLRAGDDVNLETDLLAKYVERQLSFTNQTVSREIARDRSGRHRRHTRIGKRSRLNYRELASHARRRPPANSAQLPPPSSKSLARLEQIVAAVGRRPHRSGDVARRLRRRGPAAPAMSHAAGTGRAADRAPQRRRRRRKAGDRAVRRPIDAFFGRESTNPLEAT